MRSHGPVLPLLTGLVTVVGLTLAWLRREWRLRRGRGGSSALVHPGGHDL